MSDVSPEIELLIALCRKPLPAPSRNRIDRLIDQDIDWALFVSRAIEWQVEPVVFSNLRLSYADAMPADVRGQVAEKEKEARAHALTRTLVLMDLLDIFAREGIRVLVLKGPAVSLQAYGDASLRSFADMDLLVRHVDLPRARDLLLASRYKRDYSPEDERALVRQEHALEFSNSRSKVELHWSLLSRHLRLNMDVDSLWGEARTIACAGGTIEVLAPHHLFLFLSAHGAKHEWANPRWICDIVQLLSSMSQAHVDAVVELASRAHAIRIVKLALQVTQDFFGERISVFPHEWSSDDAATNDLRSMVSYRLRTGSGPPPVEGWLASLDPRLKSLVFWTKARERLIDRICCIGEVLFVPTGRDKAMGSLGWASRPLRLAARALRRGLVA